MPQCKRCAIVYRRVNAPQSRRWGVVVRRRPTVLRNGFGVTMIDLPTDLPGQLVSALPHSVYALRIRRWSDGRSGESALTYDAASGVQVLDPMLCVRVIRPLI